jgi:hypothetical protein
VKTVRNYVREETLLISSANGMINAVLQCEGSFAYRRAKAKLLSSRAAT